MTKQIIEALKTALIVMLSASALFLIGASGAFGELFDSNETVREIKMWLSSGREKIAVKREAVLEAAVIPMEIAVSSETVGHHGVKHDAQIINTLYDRASNILGEALGSAMPPEEVTEKEWRAALSGTGLYFCFYTKLPLQVLTRWHGQAMLHENPHSASRLSLTQNAEGVELYYYCPDEDTYFRCVTAARAVNLQPLTEEYRPNGTLFAFEIEGMPGEPYTMILESSPPSLVLASENPVYSRRGALETALTAFGFNPYTQSSYTEGDGTVVYVESFGILKLSENGFLSYREAERDTIKPAALREATEIGTLIETARKLLEAVFGGWSMDENIYLSRVDELEDGTYELVFDYYVNAVRVHLKDENAAVISIEDGQIVKALICLRSYTITEEEALLLPERQAAALARHSPAGTELKLVYTETAPGRLEPMWSYVIDG